jgi:subtilisin family serine protease
MNESLPSPTIPTPRVKPGCGALILYAALFVWVSLLVMAASLANWVIEQGNFSGEITLPNVRWAIILVEALLVLAPCLAAARALKTATLSTALRAWGLAGVFALLLFPSYFTFITDFQLTMLLKIVGMLVYLVLLLAWRRAAKISLRPLTWAGTWLGLLCAGLMAFPWLVDGALGSVTDTFLAFLAALLFGLSAALTLELTLQQDPAASRSRARIWWQGFNTIILLAIMTSGVAESGNQTALLLAVPLAGLGMAALTVYGGAPFSQRVPIALLAGAALFWPLALVDPDELMAVITGGPGDMMQLALRMTAIALGVGLLLGLTLLLLQNRLRRASRRIMPEWPVTVLVWLVLGFTYLFAGQPGLYGEHIFVILKDQADVSAADSIKDIAQRRNTVYRNLIEQADQTQAPIRQTLDILGIRYTPYYLVNALEVDAGPLVEAWLETRPEVDRILPSPHLRPLHQLLPVNRGNLKAAEIDTWNLKMIHADRVINELHVTGKGVIVGQSDSGADVAHPELATQYRGRGGEDNYNWYDPWYQTHKPTDLDGHGTHTLGTILGQHVGVAPGAQWIACSNLARNLGNPGYYLDCMQFMLAPFPQSGDAFKDGDPELGAMVLNDSWGCPDVEGCDPDTLLPAVRALRHAGVFVVASAGNNGMSGCGSVKDPIALYSEVYSVGAVNSAGDLAGFSSLGPVRADGSNRVKPDIVAPGENVFSSTPQNTYAAYSGTSMAGPHVVGVVALMWSANPALIGDIERTTRILDTTAQPYHGQMPQCVSANGTPNNAVGYGIVDAYAAVKAALSAGTTP